jgi:hypothetical protein
MRLNMHRTAFLIAVTCAAIASATVVGSTATHRFYDDDPIRTEPATQDASRVKPNEVKLFVDLAYNVITGTEVANPGRAKNVNTIDEVPDSAWYTNRLGYLALTPDDITRGPNTTDGPAQGTWTVTSSKSDGITPGFTIKDATGQRWFLKFDPPGYRGMATGTEVVATKLMWALGYNVPENHIAHLRRSQLVVGERAKYTPAGGTTRAMRASDIDALLSRAERDADGSYRIVASKALEGTPVGRIRFFGVRPDDPNDIVPHEDRRELRGYGVFAAWLNHVDAKAINSLDTLITENGRSYVRHHLIDFGSAMGSGGIAPAEYSAGHEYLVERGLAGKRLLAFGFARPEWQRRPYYEARSIGRMQKENGDFNPETWKPRIPNQAFLHAREDDKFWAARKLMALTTDMIRAAVRAGEFDDPTSEDFLVRALAQRRDAIGRAYLTGVNPIVDPALDDDGTLTFTNAAVDTDVARVPSGYRAVWSTYDNTTGLSRRIGETATARTTVVIAPDDLPRTDGQFIQVSLSAFGAPHESWEKPVHAFFRMRNGSWRLVGLERMPEL